MDTATHDYFKYTEPMNKIEVWITTFITSLNFGFFAFVTASDLNLVVAFLSMAFMILRNLKYCIMAIAEMYLFFKAVDKWKIINMWKKEQKELKNKSDNANKELDNE